MKHQLLKILILPLLTSGTLSFAQEVSSAPADGSATLSSSTDITRLNYYPHARKLYVAPDLVGVPTDEGTATRSGLPLNSSASHYWQADLNVVYGLPLEGLRIGIAESWQIHRWTDTTSAATGFVRQTDSSGLSDPTLELQYRYSDSHPLGFAGDINLSVSPSWVNHTVATTTAEGNNGRGYGTTSLGANFYWIYQTNDLGMAAAITRDFSGSGANPTNPLSSYTRDSNWTESVSVSDRYHFTNDFYGQVGIGFDFGSSYDQTNQAAIPVTTTYQTPFHLNPNLMVGDRLGEKFVLEALYNYLNYTSTSATATSTTSTQTTEDTYELRARFEI